MIEVPIWVFVALVTFVVATGLVKLADYLIKQEDRRVATQASTYEDKIKNLESELQLERDGNSELIAECKRLKKLYKEEKATNEAIHKDVKCLVGEHRDLKTKYEELEKRYYILNDLYNTKSVTNASSKRVDMLVNRVCTIERKLKLNDMYNKGCCKCGNYTPLD